MAKPTEDTQETQKLANIWTKVANPLRMLNNAQIEQMLNNARLGNDVRLQVAYNEMEKSVPIFSACINKRIAGVQSRQWDIVPVDETPQAAAQAELVKKMFVESDLQVEDNLTDCLRHLTLASFRGRSAVKPFIEDGKLVFKALDNWNFLRYNGKNYWNPNVEQTFLFSSKELPKGVVELPQDEVCYVFDDKAIDFIGMTIYLRQLIGEEQWARVVEKQGIAQIVLKCPENTPDTELQKYSYRAQALFEGGSGVLPHGVDIAELNKSAQTASQIFTEYLTHQQELFCILAVGGTISTLGGTQGSAGTGMGSSTADNQTAEFNNLVSYDCKRIQNALNVAVKKCLSWLGESQMKCRFQFIEKNDTTPSEYLELAQKCKALGLAVDAQKLKELTGLQFIQDEQSGVWSPEEQES